ncbi:hypothetical protein EVS87_001455 [Bacillus altitudinis]|nr:hypothetical protein EVS87_001455 [Bacillus altitudinis]
MLALFLFSVFCKQKYSRITYQFLLVLKKRLLKFEKRFYLIMLFSYLNKNHKNFNFAAHITILLM